MDPLLYISDYSEYKTSTKTEEEIKKLTLEENMSELKRSVYILSKGMPIQKTAIYMNLHQILLEPEGWQKIIPLVNDEIVNQSEENQIEAAKSLVKLINNNNIDEFNLNILLKMCFSMLKIWNQPVLDEWVILFASLIQKLSYDQIEKDCHQLILNLSECSQHVTSKYIASRMMGFIAEKISKPFTGLIFDRSRILCQDPDSEVRKIMSSEVLEKICNNVGGDITESKLLEKILELIYDSDVQIKLQSIDLLINVLDLLSYECKKTRMIQTFVDLLSTVNEEIYKKMSFQIGKIVYKLESAITKVPSQLATIQNFYKECGLHKLAEVRKNFAYNLPYLITMLEQKEFFKNIYLKLFKDSVKDVKYQAVICLHEICKLIGPEESQRLFKECFEGLFKEEDKNIIEKFISKLTDLLNIFLNPIKSNGVVEDLKINNNLKEMQNLRTFYLEKVIHLINTIKKMHYWRLELNFLDEFLKMMHLFNIRDLNNKYLPYLMDTIKKGAVEVRTLAARNLILFLRTNYITNKTKEIINQIIDDFYNSVNYKFRMIFIDIFIHMSKTYSTKYLKQHNILQSCMNLANDKVLIVRRKFTKALPYIRKVILFDDNEYLKKLDNIINQLTYDQDKEISENAIKFKMESKYNNVVESPAQIAFEEKRRTEEEEELRNKEIKELEDQKKAKTEENAISKLDYLQSLGIDKLKSSKIGKKSVKETTFPKINSGLKPPSSSGSNTSGSIITPKTKIISSMPVMLPKQGIKVNYSEESIQFNSLYKPTAKISTNTLLINNDNYRKKSNSLLSTTSENIHANPKISSTGDIDKLEKERTSKKSSSLIKSLAVDDNFKNGLIMAEPRATSSTNKLTTILKDKDMKDMNPTFREPKYLPKKK